MSDSQTYSSTGAAPEKSLVDHPLFNAVWFQVTWFLAVLGREDALHVTVAMLLLHLLLAPSTMRELKQVLALATIGISVDAGFSLLGLFQFAGGALIPAWLVCLWMAFATTLNRSLSFLGRNTLLTILAGAFVIPFNYWVGQKLGAVEFGYPLPLTLVAMSCVWAVTLPFLYRLLHLR